tara:strand:- start:655 stop:852 length:198 start_codon:yes stop_codon:yes gene_type:complete
MVTMTLDETEYETEDFTEDQHKLLREIQYNNNIQMQLNYQSNSLQAANDAIVNKLRISLEAKEGS